jgi:hypothetical protein
MTNRPIWIIMGPTPIVGKHISPILRKFFEKNLND